MSVKHRTIVAEAWANFEHECLPVDAPFEHRRALRGAFYAGASTLLLAILEGIAPGNDAAGDDINVLESIDNELRAFAGVGPRSARPN